MTNPRPSNFKIFKNENGDWNFSFHIIMDSEILGPNVKMCEVTCNYPYDFTGVAVAVHSFYQFWLRNDLFPNMCEHYSNWRF